MENNLKLYEVNTATKDVKRMQGFNIIGTSVLDVMKKIKPHLYKKENEFVDEVKIISTVDFL